MPFKLTDAAIRAAKPRENATSWRMAKVCMSRLPPVGASGGVSSTVLPEKKSDFPLACIPPWA